MGVLFIPFCASMGEERPALKSRAQLTKKKSVMQSQSNGRKKSRDSIAGNFDRLSNHRTGMMKGRRK